MEWLQLFGQVAGTCNVLAWCRCCGRGTHAIDSTISRWTAESIIVYAEKPLFFGIEEDIVFVELAP